MDQDYIKRLRERLALSSDAEASSCARTVLCALADRLSWRSSNDLACYLPSELANQIRTTACSGTGGVRFAPYSAFVATIARQERVSTSDAEARALGVIKVLCCVVPFRELERIAADLPLWLVSPLGLPIPPRASVMQRTGESSDRSHRQTSSSDERACPVPKRGHKIDSMAHDNLSATSKSQTDWPTTVRWIAGAIAVVLFAAGTIWIADGSRPP